MTDDFRVPPISALLAPAPSRGPICIGRRLAIGFLTNAETCSISSPRGMTWEAIPWGDDFGASLLEHVLSKGGERAVGTLTRRGEHHGVGRGHED